VKAQRVKKSDLPDFVAQWVRGIGRPRSILFATSGPELLTAARSWPYETVFSHDTADALLKCSGSFPALVILDLAAETFAPWNLLGKAGRIPQFQSCPVLLLGESMPEHRSRRPMSWVLLVSSARAIPPPFSPRSSGFWR